MISSKENSNALLTYTALFTWFVVEYLFLEVVHLYTYDLFAEKIGFKLVWGCLFFYPFFYTLNGYILAMRATSSDPSNDLSPIASTLIFLLFFRFQLAYLQTILAPPITLNVHRIKYFYKSGWIITRGANMQKFFFKRYPEHKKFLFGLIEQTPLRPGSRLLCSVVYIT